MGGGWPGWAGCCLFNSAASWRIAAPVNLSGKGAEEPETWLVSCGGCRVSADVKFIQVWELRSVGGARARAVFRSRVHLWLGLELKLQTLG